MTNIVDPNLFPVQGGGQTLAVSGTSAQSAVVGNQIEYVQITPTEDMYVEFGGNPTATASSMFISGDGLARIYKIRPGFKVAALQVSAAGTLYIHELTR